MLTDLEVKKNVKNESYLIESIDEMSSGYLKMIKDTLTIVADTEIMGAALYYGFLNHKDVNDRRYRQLMALIQDEIGHAHVHYRLLEDLGGGTVEEMLYEREYTDFNYPYAMDMPIETYEEVALIGAFQDRAGATLLIDPFNNTSYGPWKRALAKVEIEERFHMNLGISLIKDLISEPESRKRLQEAVDWMFPITVEWFGVPDKYKKRKDQLEFRLRKLTNDQLRQEWLSQVVPICEQFGLKVPAHYDAISGEYVLDYKFPCEFDVKNKKWHYDKETTWDEVKKRWKGRGPNSKSHIGIIQEEYRKMKSKGGL
ncbi:phenylacetic acid catabolic [Bacillus sp. M6-12]|uniref:Phenylacetic acid catabolic protein n=1 Tax=Bacillus sp. M6-12 TaxID=2054166 RepID=UPI000C76177F|nr:Phenylacetic acid catabolic protein [Bacillus sp. M6-12]PLS18569.1 phenylacetic acid catabolic [Bacillus sp. M6-12]